MGCGWLKCINTLGVVVYRPVQVVCGLKKAFDGVCLIEILREGIIVIG